MWYMQIISSHKKKLNTDVYDKINNFENKKLHVIWFSLYEMSRISKDSETENKLAVT